MIHMNIWERCHGWTNLEVGLHSLKVQTNSTLVEVSIAAHFQTAVAEHRKVVGPSWGRKIYYLSVWIMTRKEGSSDAQSASSRDRSSDSNLQGELHEMFTKKVADRSLLEWSTVSTIRKFCCVFCEFGQTGNRKVFFVWFGTSD